MDTTTLTPQSKLLPQCGTVLCFGGGSVVLAAEGRWSRSSSSTAWRELMPSARITHSMTSPPSRQAPLQCKTFCTRSMLRLGLVSLWKLEGTEADQLLAAAA